MKSLQKAGATTPGVIVDLAGDDTDAFLRIFVAEAGIVVTEEVHNSFRDFVAEARRVHGGVLRERLAWGDPNISIAIGADEMKKRKVVGSEDLRHPEIVAPAMGAQLPRRRREGRPAEAVLGLEQREEKNLGKWLERLESLIQESPGQHKDMLSQAADAKAALRSILGGARLGTLRLRIRAWEEFRGWLLVRFGRPWPQEMVEVLDFVHEQVALPCSASCPLKFGATLNWVEARCGIWLEQRLGRLEMVKLTLDRAKVDLKDVARQVRRAPRFIAIMIAALELVLGDAEVPLVKKVYSWFRLVKFYAALRWDDLQRLRPGDLALLGTGLSGRLRRTKTTGAGKSVRELPVYIPANANLVNAEWLVQGWDLIKHIGDGERDYLVPKADYSGNSFVKGPAPPSEAAAWSRVVLTSLRIPIWRDDMKRWVRGRDQLLENALVVAWTGHSERASLPSALAALGVHRESRQMIGRWRPEAGDEYIRTYRATVRNVITIFLKSIYSGASFTELDEEDAVQDVAKLAIEKGSDAEAVKAGADWLICIAEDFSVLVGKEGIRRVMAGDKAQDAIVKEMQGIVSAAVSGSDDGEGVQAAGEDTEYLVCKVRGKGGCLHLASGCWRARRRIFKDYVVFKGYVPPEQYGPVCLDCFSEAMGEDEEAAVDSTSTTSSE